jgi:hypothetical protein
MLLDLKKEQRMIIIDANRLKIEWRMIIIDANRLKNSEINP